MKRLELRVLGALATLCLVLVLFDPWRVPPASSDSRLLSPDELGGLTDIYISNADAEIHTQVQADGLWAVQRTGGAVSALAIRSTTDVLGLLRVVRSARPAVSHGLGEGAAVVRLTRGTEQTVTLHIGSLTSDGRRRWVRRDATGPSVLVEAHLVDELLENASRLSTGPLMPWAVGSEVRVESEGRWVQWKAPWLRWSDGSAVREVVGNTVRIQAWLRAIASIRATSESCTRPPSLSVSVGNKSLDLSKFGCLTIDALGEVLASFSDPETLADMHLFSSARPLQDFSIVCGAQRRDVVLAEIDQAALWGWWGKLRNAPLQLVPKQGGDARCTISGQGFRVALAEKNGSWVASSPHPGFDFALPPETNKSFSAISELFRERLLIAEDAIFLSSLTWEEGGRITQWEREEGSLEWTSRGRVLGADVRDALDRAAGVLATLRVHSFGTEDSVLATAILRASFLDPIDGGLRTYRLEQFGDARECLVRVDAHQPARLTSEDCSAIWLGRL